MRKTLAGWGWKNSGRGSTDLQLLQPVLTLGLLVLARLGFGGSLEVVVGLEELAVGAGDGRPLRWLIPGAMTSG
jgi:hypothetical protein